MRWNATGLLWLWGRDLNVSEWVSFSSWEYQNHCHQQKISRRKSFSHLFWWLGLPQPKTNKLIIHIQLVKLQKTLILAKGKVASWKVLMTKESSCDLWPKSFATSRALWSHEQTHVGKRFNCQECKKSFSQNSTPKKALPNSRRRKALFLQILFLFK